MIFVISAEFSASYFKFFVCHCFFLLSFFFFFFPSSFSSISARCQEGCLWEILGALIFSFSSLRVIKDDLCMVHDDGFLFPTFILLFFLFFLFAFLASPQSVWLAQLASSISHHRHILRLSSTFYTRSLKRIRNEYSNGCQKTTLLVVAKWDVKNWK